jgi:hypothetical protein
MHPRTIRSDPAQTVQRQRNHWHPGLITALAAAFLIVSACQRQEYATPKVSSTPASIRGWLVPAENSDQSLMYVTDTANTADARQVRVFEQTALSVEGAPFASGGIGGNGAFIILDVPHGDVVINFQPPDGMDAQLTLTGVPPNADILLPGLKYNGTQVEPIDPSRIVVRIPARIASKRPVAGNVIVGGHKVQVFETPLSELVDRRDFPNPK